MWGLAVFTRIGQNLVKLNDSMRLENNLGNNFPQCCEKKANGLLLPL